MDFAPSPAQLQMIETARGTVTDFLQHHPDADMSDVSVWQAAGTYGWPGLCMPEDMGGAGQDALSTALVFEALGRAGLARSTIFALGAHLFGCAMAIANHGSETQKHLWGPQLARGHAVGALALTEPQSGSDVTAGQMAARREGDAFYLSGTKTLVSNAPVASVFVVNATTSRTGGGLGSTAFLVPRDTPGLSVTPLQGHIGMPHAPMGQVTFDNCPLPDTALLGHEGQGLGILLSITRWERSCILAGFLGAAERDLVAVTNYLSKRKNNGNTLMRHQAVGHKLAELRALIEGTRWVLYRCIWDLHAGTDPILYPALAKLLTSRAAVTVARELQELMAGAGWLDACGLATALTDAMGVLTASGTAAVQLNAISTRLRRV